MKKLLLIILLLVAVKGYSQSDYFINDTSGTVAKRLVTFSNIADKKYCTITGYADNTIYFSFGDSLFSTGSSISFDAGKPILIYQLWLPKYSNYIWYKTASNGTNVDLQVRVN